MKVEEEEFDSRFGYWNTQGVMRNAQQFSTLS